MPNSYSSLHILKILKQHGFSIKSTKGSHVKLKKNSLTVILPHPKKQIPLGTLRSIIRQGHLNLKDFS